MLQKRWKIYNKVTVNKYIIQQNTIMDIYERQARVYPAIAGTIIPMILTCAFIFTYLPTELTNRQWLIRISTVVPIALIYGSLGYWGRQQFIDISKLLFQYPLFKQDETNMPTTQLLLWSSPKRKSGQDIKAIARKIKKDFNITLLSEEQERENLIEAQKTIVDAVGKIREVTRGNENLQQYNRKFGFCRNYLGSCVCSIGFIIFAIILDSIFDWGFTVILISALIIQILLGTLAFGTLKLKGDEYARALFNAYIAG